MARTMRPLEVLLLVAIFIIGAVQGLQHWPTNRYAVEVLHHLVPQGTTTENQPAGVLNLALDEGAATRKVWFTGHLYWVMGDYARARNAFLQTDNSILSTDITEFFIGWSHVKEGQPERAVQYWTEVEFDPAKLSALGRHAFLQDKPEEGIIWYDMAASLAPDNIVHQCRRASAYVSVGRGDEVVAPYLQAMENWVNARETVQADCLYNAGFWSLEAGNPERALRFWQPLLGWSPNAPLPDPSLRHAELAYLHLRLANIWRDNGSHEQEKVHLQQAVAWGEGINRWYVQQAQERLANAD